MTRRISQTTTYHVAAMSPKGTSVQIFGFLSLLVIWTCQVAANSQPTVLELILDSLKNIEDIIRESSKPTIYLTSSVGRNVIMNIPHHLPLREVAVNVDPYESEELRGHLQRHPPPKEAVGSNDSRRPQQSSTANWLLSQVSNENVNSDRYSKVRKQPEDDIMPFLLDSTLNEKYRRSFRNGNTNENTNVNSNSNNNYNARTPVSADLQTNLGKINGGIRVYGARSLSRNRDVNRNVNRNVNTNTNTNTMDY